MNTSELSFRALTIEECESVYHSHMERDFPDDELKPLDMLKSLIAGGLNTMHGCFYQGRLAGYYVLARESNHDFILLDYLAVVSELRGHGFGSAILSHLRENLHGNEYLLIESEYPEAALNERERMIRRRRIHFYREAGAQLTKLRILLFGVDFSILVLQKGGSVPSEPELARSYLSLYGKMLSPERCRQKIRVILPDSER